MVNYHIGEKFNSLTILSVRHTKNNFNYLVIDCRKDNLKYVNDILNKYISSLKVGVVLPCVSVMGAYYNKS